MFDDLQDTVLEGELCSQAARVTAGECRLVLLVGEFDRRQAWAGHGMRSCAHWLNWRVGTSMGAAREQVRVGRALEALPHVRGAFQSGELSYSKVRALTRVATAGLDEGLTELARHATACQLEQIVREYRKADPDEAAVAKARHHSRYLRSFTAPDGMVLINARLSPEEGAVVLAAIESARAELSAAAEAEDVPAGTPGELDTQVVLQDGEATAADALVAVCGSVLSRGLSEEIEDPVVTVVVHVDDKVLADPSSPGCAHIEGIGAITAHSAARLACEGAVSTVVFRPDGSVEPRGTTRVIPRRLRRALLARDRGCRWPGCTARKFLHAHHVVFWSRGGPTAMSNLVTLCSAHHRLVHEGGWQLKLERSGRLGICSPEGIELPGVPKCQPAQGPELVSSSSLAYGGESFDLGLTIDSLLCRAGKMEC